MARGETGGSREISKVMDWHKTSVILKSQRHHGLNWTIHSSLFPHCALSSETPLRRSTSLPSDLDLWNHSEGDINALPLTPEATPTSSLNFTWDTHSAIDYKSLTPPSTPTLSPTAGFGVAAAESPKGAGTSWGLGRAVGWIRNIASERTSNYIKTEDSKSSAASSSK